MKKTKHKSGSPDVDPFDAQWDEWQKNIKLDNKKLFNTGDKRKLTEIKKTFKIDKFNKILNSDEGIDIFKAIETISKIEITMFDEFHTKIGLTKFFISKKYL